MSIALKAGVAVIALALCATAIGVVDGQRGDGRDAEEIGEFGEPSVLIHGGTI